MFDDVRMINVILRTMTVPKILTVLSRLTSQGILIRLTALSVLTVLTNLTALMILAVLHSTQIAGSIISVVLRSVQQWIEHAQEQYHHKDSQVLFELFVFFHNNLISVLAAA